MTETTTPIHPSELMSQASYEETAYADESWPIIGHMSEKFEFAPLEVDRIALEVAMIDPMFADYGGIADPQIEKRWHLPEHATPDSTGRSGEVALEEGQIVIAAAEVERLKQEAYAAGQKAGLEAAVLENVEKLAKFEERIREVVGDLKRQLDEQIAQTERSAVELALQVAHKIIDTTVDINPDYITHILKEAISQSGSAMISKIRVSPQDMEFIEVVGITKLLPDTENEWRFEADPGIRSGCVVETSAGEIDFQLDRAWEQIKENVLKVIR